MTAKNEKIQSLLFVLKQSYICFYIICMIVPLKRYNGPHFNTKLINIEKHEH